MCAAPKQGQKLPAGVDVEKETVLTGQVTDASGNPVAGAFVRLLDSTGEFTAEVVASAHRAAKSLPVFDDPAWMSTGRCCGERGWFSGPRVR